MGDIVTRGEDRRGGLDGGGCATSGRKIEHCGEDVVEPDSCWNRIDGRGSLEAFWRVRMRLKKLSRWFSNVVLKVITGIELFEVSFAIFYI